ncbi:PAP2 (acid phosphatase) superfamily protein [Cedecea davisae]|uniref:PAP2 family protein n=1 Tax=Cedecea davisae DSM 4568 TaxID=566551 RepID=S3IS09_9ENTR|nr:phosphatase PAP2 family protein [Cedecea davisae]EPF15830.1 PAP2 family protein [Cedecea davisae DSM 4568]SUX38608.1 PAP2 (acid phosphatase) superfamily protein [Cedecea davisae]
MQSFPKPTVNKTKLLYRLPPRFYLFQLFILIMLAIIFSWLARDEGLDRWITGYWFDAATRQFPLQNNRLLDLLNHRLLKDLVIVGGALSLMWGLWRRQPRLVVVALLIGLGALTVGILKDFSHHSCPWSLAEYGGNAVSYPLFGAVPAGSGPGRCFPGGHASSGFGVMALFFLFYRERPRLAWFCLFASVFLGIMMGYGQVMRGAHFFSHNLWAGWWVWLTQVAIYGLLSTWLVKEQETL